MVSLMKAVNNPSFGTLPDFGNVNPGDDNAEVLRKIVPYAKGISVKASWLPDGTHNKAWDLEKMIKICQDAGYHGYWGIESNYGAPRPSLNPHPMRSGRTNSKACSSPRRSWSDWF